MALPTAIPDPCPDCYSYARTRKLCVFTDPVHGTRYRPCEECLRAWNRARTANARARAMMLPGRVGRAQVRGRFLLYGDRCWICGDVATSVDHVIPLGGGGANLPANIRPACDRCNQAKGGRRFALAALRPHFSPVGCGARR